MDKYSLLYHGNHYVHTTGAVPLCLYGNFVEGQVHFSVSSIQQAVIDGVIHINVSEDD